MSDLPLPPSKAGGRSVSISEERQFGVSTIYRSVSISEERQFGVSTIYRLEVHTHVSTGPKISRFNYCIQCLYPLYVAVKAHSKKYRLSSTYCIMLCVIIAEL